MDKVIFKRGRPGEDLIEYQGKVVGAINRVGNGGRYDVVIYKPRRELIVYNAEQARARAKQSVLYPESDHKGGWRFIDEHQPEVQPEIRLRSGLVIEEYDPVKEAQAERDYLDNL
jgi:hypothetical protein